MSSQRLDVGSWQIVGLLLLLAANAASAQRLTEDLILGTGEHHATEDFYRSVGSVTTDSNGRIFVTEYHGGDIRVYAQDGEYLTTLGSRGAAPGEFQTINALGMTPDGRLVVLDQRNHRFTWFAPGLDHYDIAPVHGERQLWASQILNLSEKEFLLSQSSFRWGEPEGAASDWGVLHVHAPTFERTASFADGEDFSPDDEMGEARLKSGLRYLNPLVLHADSVLVSEEYYPGYLTLFVRKDGAWRWAQTWQGTPVERRYRVLDQPHTVEWEDLPWQSIPTGWAGPGGSWRVDVWSTSRGLALSPAGTILHFSYIFDGRQGVFGVEEFARDGQLIAYHKLQRSREGHTAVPLAHAMVMHQDALGNIYFSHGEDGAPVVRRMQWRPAG
ncbi:MAG: hypothetical protein JJ896_05350 [Rhodothermales bacterium]|nr:hypothetical protein [Rhodothermales bacterium]MBO6779060.1 hypothetical protein [Rhodothermales bacterium]